MIKAELAPISDEEVVEILHLRLSKSCIDDGFLEAEEAEDLLDLSDKKEFEALVNQKKAAA
eukprot:2349172-Prorocentrum_lima.AAC.1